MNTKLLLSPHNDDETLFAGFLVERYSPDVVIVYDSHIQVARGSAWCSAETRRNESKAALGILGAGQVRFCGIPDTETHDELVQASVAGVMDGYEEIWAPLPETGGHDQHNAVGMAARAALKPGQRLRWYTTYRRGAGRTRAGVPGFAAILYGVKLHPVVPKTLDSTRMKLLALACYTSQINLAGCNEWFQGDLAEFESEAMIPAGAWMKVLSEAGARK